MSTLSTLVYPECWHFDYDAISKIDDVLTEHGGLLHVLSYSLTFYVGTFLLAHEI